MLMWNIQRPANFDFAVTRAINAPHTHGHPSKPADESTEPRKGDLDEKEDSSPSPDVRSVSETPGVTDEDELDHAALKKAFRFAAWSSVALVRSIRLD